MVGYAAMISFPEFQKEESWTLPVERIETPTSLGSCRKSTNPLVSVASEVGSEYRLYGLYGTIRVKYGKIKPRLSLYTI